MNALVMYESMYGNTHHIASAIADGLRPIYAVTVLPVEGVDREQLGDIDLLVVGGPTHGHGMSRPSTRKAAVDAAEEPASDLAVEPDAEGPGLREWFDRMGRLDTSAAAFDTRVAMAPVLTGRASKGIARKLRHGGATLVVEPESFLVTKDNHLEPGEEERARAWGSDLASAISRI
jgi:Flavodoxin domain